MQSVFHDLLINLRGGARLCCFQCLGLDDFRISIDQLVLLFLTGVLLAFSIDYLNSLPQPEFNSYALTAEGFAFATLLLGVYVVTRFVLGRQDMLSIPVLILSTTPVFLIALELLDQLILIRIEGVTLQTLGYTGYVVWGLAVILWCIRTTVGRATMRVSAGFVILLLCWLVPVWQLADYDAYWYAGEEQEGGDAYAAYRELDVERLFYQQPELLSDYLVQMTPDRPGVTDVYFLGVGAYARQDVFLKETLFATRLFEERFDARGRSLALINHLSTRDELPLATASNLTRALNHIGRIMNPEEDVLVLYMTSHGSRDHKFSMDFWPMPLNDITPAMLRDYLDEAGIKWRVVMISACYSGGFLAPLRSPAAALAFAAAPDRKSFGCSNENDFTYFGEALLKDQLQVSWSIPAAFSNASAAISRREEAEKLGQSEPQFFVGDEILPLLETLNEELPGRVATPEVVSGF